MVVVSETYLVVFLKARLLLSLQVMVPIRLVSSSHTTHISFIVCTAGGDPHISKIELGCHKFLNRFSSTPKHSSHPVLSL
jgi:hypothetical protein